MCRGEGNREGTGLIWKYGDYERGEGAVYRRGSGGRPTRVRLRDGKGRLLPESSQVGALAMARGFLPRGEVRWVGETAEEF